MKIILLDSGERLVIKGADNSTPEPAPDNAETVKSWGEPGSKVRQRVTDRADAKAAEDKELFKNLARLLYRRLPAYQLDQLEEEGPELDWLRNWLNTEATKYTFVRRDPYYTPYGQALRAIERQESEDETE